MVELSALILQEQEVERKVRRRVDPASTWTSVVDFPGVDGRVAGGEIGAWAGIRVYRRYFHWADRVRGGRMDFHEAGDSACRIRFCIRWRRQRSGRWCWWRLHICFLGGRKDRERRKIYTEGTEERDTEFTEKIKDKTKRRELRGVRSSEPTLRCKTRRMGHPQVHSVRDVTRKTQEHSQE